MAKKKEQQYDAAAMLLGGVIDTEPERAPEGEPTKQAEAKTPTGDSSTRTAETKPKAKTKQTTSKPKPQQGGKPKREAAAKRKESAAAAPGSAARSYRQKRDKRLQVVMTQELFDRLQAEKELTGAKSVNEIVNVLLEQGLKKRG